MVATSDGPLQPGTRGFEVTDDNQLIEALVTKPPGPVIPVACAYLDGFIQDHYTEYCRPSVRLPQAGWRPGQGFPRPAVVLPVDTAGHYHLGFILYDGPGRESLDVCVDDEPVGSLAATRDDNRRYLYVSEQPVYLRAGSRIRLMAVSCSGICRLEDALLLAEQPPLVRRGPMVRGLRAVPAWLVTNEPGFADQGCANTVVAWRTDGMSKCVVELGLSPGQWTAVGSTDNYASNHRLVLRHLVYGRRYALRVTGHTRHGEQLTAGVCEFTAGRLPEPVACGQEARSGTGEVALRIDIRRRDTSALGLEQAWPVTFGVPLAQGLRQETRGMVVMDQAGLVVPAQLTAASYWPDASIKWLHIDAQVTASHEAWSLVTAGGCPVTGGEHREQPPAPQPHGSLGAVRVTDEEAFVLVCTGAVTFRVPRASPGLLQDVTITTPAGEMAVPLAGVAMEVIDEDGNSYTATPETVAVESYGPRRVTIMVEGGYLDKCAKRLGTYQCRLHAYAGLPWIRIAWAYENDTTSSDFVSLRSMSVHLVAARPADRIWVGCDTGVEHAAGPAARVQLLQWLDDRYVMWHGNRERMYTGSRAPGWAEAGDGTASFGVALDEFWQRYPKQLLANTEGISVGMCPPLPGGIYDSFAGTPEEHRLFYFLREGCYRLRQGASFSQELLVDFSPAGQQPHVAALAQTLADPPVAVASSESFALANVFGDLGLVEGPAAGAYDKVVASCLAAFTADRERQRAYGFLNYGDWWGERRVNWGNCEYDTALAFLLEYARSGNPCFLRLGRAAQMHHRDVDTIRHHADRSRVGLVCLHAMGHTGGYFAQSKDEWGPGSPETAFAVDHTWVEGHLAAYWLTGDRRALETADLVGRRQAGLGMDDFDFTNCRIPGWLLILTTALYQATNDPYYLNAAAMVASRVLERQTSDGGWRRQLMPGHCFHLPRHQGNASFMVGVLMSGLRRYLDVCCSSAVARSLVCAARFLVSDMWMPAEGAFRYTSCPHSPPAPDLNFLILDGLVHAYVLTGDPALAEVVEVAGGRHMDFVMQNSDDLDQDHDQGVGKIVSMTMCFTPAIVGTVDRISRAHQGA